jgi:hypothetical protein
MLGLLGGVLNVHVTIGERAKPAHIEAILMTEKRGDSKGL